MSIVCSILATLALATQSQTAEMRLMRYPTIHGDQVVFTYAGDLWTSTKEGGIARRLTTGPGLERNAFFSKDGKWIAFTASYDGAPNVYVMPSEGGDPKRLTFDPNGDLVEGWTPDGKVAYISTAGNFTNRESRLWLVDPRGSLPTPTAMGEVGDLSYSPDGGTVAFNRQISDNFNWRRYRGGSQGYISLFDFKTNQYSELPHGNENSWRPMWVGDSIYSVSDKVAGTVNLYRYDLATKKQVQLTHFTDEDIKWPSTDGKSIVFEQDGYLDVYDIATGALSKLHPQVLSDDLAARPRLMKLGANVSEVALSPSGARLAVGARGQLFSVPAKSGITRQLPNTAGARERFVDWSPDGKLIAFASDVSGDYQVYTMPQLGGTPTQVSDYSGAQISGLQWSPDSKLISFTTQADELKILNPTTKAITQVFKNPYGPVQGYDWSPDGKWIAYVVTGENQFNSLHLYRVDTGKDTKVTDGYYNDTAASFDLSGKYLYLVSARTFGASTGDYDFQTGVTLANRIYVLTLGKDTPNPLAPPDDEEGAPGKEKDKDTKEKDSANGVAIDLEGLADRALPLPLPADSYKAVIGANNGAFYVANGNLYKIDLGQKEAQPIIEDFGNLTFNANRTKLAYYSHGTLGVADVHQGIKVGEGKVNTNGVEAVIDPRAEWRQIFWEAWRYERDHYYDKDFLGMNWKAIGDHYAKYLPYVGHRSDLNYVLGLMISELGTSHSYVFGGDMGPTPAPIPTGQLGADYEADGAFVKFKKIYPGLNFEEARRGPLGAPGVNVSAGDYLLAVDGQPVTSSMDPDSLLIDKVNKSVELTVNSKPTFEGSRKVKVQPIGNEGELRYAAWVEANRQKVDKLSGGKIGYIHVPNTANEGIIEFFKGFFSQSDKEAVIIDERFNGGGFIPTFFTDQLIKTYVAYARQRNGPDIGFPTQIVNGPKAMLVNGYSGSGGDMFPWLFRLNKIGPIIGTRTWGGLVGINGEDPNLVDGGTITAPEVGFFDQRTGQWIVENHGVDPDIKVDDRPDLIAAGQDPSLEKAVQVLLDELAKGTPKVKQPDFPRVKQGGG